MVALQPKTGATCNAFLSINTSECFPGRIAAPLALGLFLSRHRYRGAHASQPLSQPPARYRPLDLNFSTLQCSTVLLYDLGTLYTVQLYTVLDQATV